MTVQYDLLAAGLLTPDGLLTAAGRQRVDELLGPPEPRERNRWQHEQHGPALRVQKGCAVRIERDGARDGR